MNMILQHTLRAPLHPSGKRLSLGWRLAMTTALVIGLIMGGISILQQRFEMQQDRQIRQEFLKMSLVPVAVNLESATSLDAMRRELERFHWSYLQKDYPVHEIVLLDAFDHPRFSTGVTLNDEDERYLTARIPIGSDLLDGQGSLKVLINREAYRDRVQRDWLLWSVHFLVTLGVVFLFLAASLYLQVTRPVNQLIRGIKKMEQGYWGPVDLSGGAWEVRWLAWRFSNMVQEVQSAMTRLFEAERKAQKSLPNSRDDDLPDTEQHPLSISPATETDPPDSSDYRELIALCERLESASPDDTQAVQLARVVWRRQALEANRLGYHQLKARLENAALCLMEPEAYSNLNKRIASLRASWQKWSEQHHETLYRLLDAQAIPCAGVLHRVKHTAGVWAKMQHKGLRLDEVYDLFAFRIIVPTEADCYAALGIIHQHYKPVLSRFKDYIAKPKGNGYRSLHTCLVAEEGPVFEIQIRSVGMDRRAERGDASHWLYKEDTRPWEPVASRWWRKLWS
jgi:ppGpp synthetase/RelA/SpoT-type nucleotidyltranferase